MLVYTDNERRDYRLQDCNGCEIYRIDYFNGIRKYQVYKESQVDSDGWPILKYFWSLKEARRWAREL